MARIVGWALSVLFFLWAGFKFVIDWIGRSTAPDDFEQIKEKLPPIFEWLYQTPWYVPAALATILSIAVIWLNRPFVRVSTISYDEAKQRGIEIPDNVAGAENNAAGAHLRLFFRDGDATPELIAGENVFRYYSLTWINNEIKEDGSIVPVSTVTALWVMYDHPVTKPNVRVRAPIGLRYEIKDSGPRHAIVLFHQLPSNATIVVETY